MLRRRAVGAGCIRGCLEVAVEISGAEDGFLLLGGNDRKLITHVGGPPAEEVVAWAKLDGEAEGQGTLLQQDTRVGWTRSDAEDETTVLGGATITIASDPPGVRRLLVGGAHYCAANLMAHLDGDESVVAVLVLRAADQPPTVPPPKVLRTIAAHLSMNTSATTGGES
jgi:hypothetical protein